MTSGPFPPPTVRHVAIAGAGIGGLTLAHALRRAGVQVTVLERAPELRPVGFGITVQANAMLALRSLGLDEAVEAEGAILDESAILDSTGRVLQGVSMRILAQRLGAPMVGIHRARLHRILLEACGADCVRTGREVVDFEERGDRVAVRLDDGEEVEADLLVGADGLHSAVRRRLLGDQPLRYAGYTSWRGICRDPEFASLDRTTESWGAGARFGIVPIGRGEIYWFATVNAPRGQIDPPGRARDGLLALLGGWHPPIERLLSRTDEADILRTDILDRRPVRRWSTGRVALLGDAAHPMTPNLGQGGCQAIEDAVVLARALQGSTTVEEALRRYEKARVRRANAIVTQSFRAGRVAQWESALLVRLRDALLRRMPPSALLRQFERAARFDPAV